MRSLCRMGFFIWCLLALWGWYATTGIVLEPSGSAGAWLWATHLFLFIVAGGALLWGAFYSEQ